MNIKKKVNLSKDHVIYDTESDQLFFNFAKKKGLTQIVPISQNLVRNISGSIIFHRLFRSV